MALPTAYLTSTKNLKSILESMQGAKAPPRFTQTFLESLGYKSTSDRLIISVLKALSFLDSAGSPTARYFDFLDPSQSWRVLADGIRDAYADLFQVNVKANQMSRIEVKNKLKTLTQGQLSDSAVDKMAATFTSLCALADFATPAQLPQQVQTSVDVQGPTGVSTPPAVVVHPGSGVPALVYTIELRLPESRDPAVYDALFRSLKEHLLK